MATPDLAACNLRAAFRELSLELVARASALSFNARRHTADADAVIEGGWSAMEEAVRAVGRRRAWPDWWPNEDVATRVPAHADRGVRVAFKDRGLLVTTASVERLLAMKLRASRPQDTRDVELLVRHRGLAGKRDALDVHDREFPHAPLRRSKFEQGSRMLTEI